MKLSIALMILVTSFNAYSAEEPTIYCRALLTEDDAKPVEYNFEFTCDNYGQDATFKSKTGRYMISAFSEESCTPQLILHDNKTNTLAVAFSMSSDRDAFSVFTNKVVAATLISDVKRENIMGPNVTMNKSIVGCSTDKELLKDVE